MQILKEMIFAGLADNLSFTKFTSVESLYKYGIQFLKSL